MTEPSKSKPKSAAADELTQKNMQPLLDTELYLPVMRDEQTITESAQGKVEIADLIGDDYQYRKIMKNASTGPGGLESNRRSDSTNQLLRVLIGFVVEFVITLSILKLAFQICGYPCPWHQTFLFSGLVALAGALTAFLLGAGLFNPISMGLSFIILLGLIHLLSDVRDWATAIKIALTARLISIGVMWLALAGAMMFFGI